MKFVPPGFPPWLNGAGMPHFRTGCLFRLGLLLPFKWGHSRSCERSDKRKHIPDLFALARWKGYGLGAKWEIPLWSPGWGKFPEKPNWICICGGGAVTHHVAHWKGSIKPAQSAYAEKRNVSLFPTRMQIASAKSRLYYKELVLSLRGRLPRDGDFLSDLNISLSWCWIMQSYFYVLI